MEIINKLRSLDLKHATYKDVFNVLGNCRLPIIESTIYKGAQIVRARRGYGFTAAKEMT